MSSHNYINYKEFENVDIRIGTVIEAYEYNELKKPSIILKIDFGEKVGIKKTSAQLQKYYKSDELINKQVIAVVNFKPKQIGKIISEVLVLGVPDLENEPVLLSPDKPVNNGGKLFLNQRGSKTISCRPPRFESDNLTSPPCDLIISLVIVNPKPLSPLSLFLEGSKVKNGLNTSSYLSLGIPSPSSLNSITQSFSFL